MLNNIDRARTLRGGAGLSLPDDAGEPRMAKWNEPTNPVFATADALNWALEHVENFGDTVFVPSAFEYAAIRHDWDGYAGAAHATGPQTLDIASPEAVSCCEGKYSYRYVTQLDPLEYLLFTALVYQVGNQLETIRVPKAAQKAFSWRFSQAPGADGRSRFPLARFQ